MIDFSPSACVIIPGYKEGRAEIRLFTPDLSREERKR